jgi:hypothetical protein
MCHFQSHSSKLAETEGTRSSFIPSLATINKALAQKGYLDFLESFIDGLCLDPIEFDKVPYCKEFYPQFKRNYYLSQKIHSLLNKGKSALPIGIDFCERVLINGEVGLESTSGQGQKCIRHATTIIGRREHQGRCQILLKNTSFCHELSPQFDCDPKTGKIWVDQDDLIKSTFGIHFF